MPLWPTIAITVTVAALAGTSALVVDQRADAERAEVISVLEDRYDVSITRTGDDLGEASEWSIDGRSWTCYVPRATDGSFEHKAMCSRDGQSFAEPSAHATPGS